MNKNEMMFDENKYNIEEVHGEIQNKFCITNRNNGYMILLDLYDDGNSKPVIFETEEEAENFIDEEISDQKSVTFIDELHIIFFNHGAYLLSKIVDNKE